MLDEYIIEEVKISSRIPGKNQGRRRQEGLIAKMLRNYPGLDLEELEVNWLAPSCPHVSRQPTMPAEFSSLSFYGQGIPLVLLPPAPEFVTANERCRKAGMLRPRSPSCAGSNRRPRRIIQGRL